MKITIENGNKKVVRELKFDCCEKCPFQDYIIRREKTCNLFGKIILQGKQCDQCKKELGELE